MLTKTIDVKKKLPDLKGLLSLVAEGTEVVLTEDNTPIARLVPISKRIYQMSFGQETHEVAPGYSHFHLVG